MDNNLLLTPEAKAIYSRLADYYTDDEKERFQYPLAAYCNELAFFHKIEKELAALPSAVQDYTNNKGKTNPTKHELTRARKESLDLVLKLARELKGTPKSAGKEETELEFNLPE
jgi:hypothetical protein